MYTIRRMEVAVAVVALAVGVLVAAGSATAPGEDAVIVAGAQLT